MMENEWSCMMNFKMNQTSQKQHNDALECTNFTVITVQQHTYSHSMFVYACTPEDTSITVQVRLLM